MRERDFLQEMLLRQQQAPQGQQVQQAQPAAAYDPEQQTRQAAQALEQPAQQVQGLIPLAELSGREMLAKSLIQQSQDRSAHPLARGIAAYFGAKNMQDISAERGRTETALQEAQARQEELRRQEDISLKREGLDIQRQGVDASREQAQAQLELSEKELNQRQEQFEQGLNLKREQFNKEAIRDAKNNAITKVPSTDGSTDLLFKGNEPITDGLEKGMQWGIDEKGNRMAVPIPTQPNEKASQTRDVALSVIKRLKNNTDGVKANFGTFSQMLPNVRSSAKEAETDLNQLRSILTVENLGLMSGVLSETDIKILERVSGGQLADTNTDEGVLRAIDELDKVFSGGSKKEEAPKRRRIKLRTNLQD